MPRRAAHFAGADGAREGEDLLALRLDLRTHIHAVDEDRRAGKIAQRHMHGGPLLGIVHRLAAQQRVAPSLEIARIGERDRARIVSRVSRCLEKSNRKSSSETLKAAKRSASDVKRSSVRKEHRARASSCSAAMASKHSNETCRFHPVKMSGESLADDLSNPNAPTGDIAPPACRGRARARQIRAELPEREIVPPRARPTLLSLLYDSYM